MNAKEKFVARLKSLEKPNSFIFSQEKIDSLIRQVQIAKVSEKKTDHQRWIMRQYDVMSIVSIQKLVGPVTKKKSKSQILLCC